MEKKILFEIPTKLIALEACPNCGGLPTIYVKERKRNGNLYHAFCTVCEYAGPACTDERSARTWWNKGAVNHDLPDWTYRKIDMIPDDTIKKLKQIAEKYVLKFEQTTPDSNDHLYWVLSELERVVEARSKLEDYTKLIYRLKYGDLKRRRDFDLAKAITDRYAVHHTANMVTPETYHWIMYELCKKF